MIKTDHRKQFREINDRWGGIDERIFDLVVTLNEIGFETLASCEGHVDHGHPTPRIVIRTVSLGAKPGTKRAAQKTTITRLQKVINAFYKIHKTGEEKIVLIQERNRGTIVLVAGEKYYRRSIRRIVRLNRLSAQGKNATLIFSEKELAAREIIVPILQKEIKEFTKFLKGNQR